MRTIKFRGKPVTSGDWVKGSLFYDRRGVPFIAQSRVDKYFIESNGSEWWDMDEVEVDPETVGQFTEHLDFTGNEIFDGSIVEDKNYRTRMIVVWHINGWYLKNVDEEIYFPLVEGENVIVVGNVWENPELLKDVN